METLEVKRKGNEWAIETIEKIRKAVEDRESRVKVESIRELEGIYSDVLLNEITKLRMQVKAELYGDGSNNCVMDLMRSIAEMHNINVGQIETVSRERKYLEPRQLLHWCLLNKVVDNSLTLEQIGELTGGQDHATVLHSKRVVRDRIATEREFREKVMRFCNGFGMATRWNGNDIELNRVV